jgi:hypothetical protein
MLGAAGLRWLLLKFAGATVCDVESGVAMRGERGDTRWVRLQAVVLKIRTTATQKVFMESPGRKRRVHDRETL